MKAAFLGSASFALTRPDSLAFLPTQTAVLAARSNRLVAPPAVPQRAVAQRTVMYDAPAVVSRPTARPTEPKPGLRPWQLLGAFLSPVSPLDRYLPDVELRRWLQDSVQAASRGASLPGLGPALIERAAAKFCQINSDGAFRLSELTGRIAETLGSPESRHAPRCGFAGWVESVPLAENAFGATRIKVRFKGIAETQAKLVDLAVPHLLTRVEKQKSERGDQLADIYGLTVVLADESQARDAYERVKSLGLDLPLRFTDEKNYLALDGRAKKNGFSALKMVAVFDGFPIEIQFRAEASVAIDERDYADPTNAAPASHAAYALKREALRAKHRREVPCFAQLELAFDRLFSAVPRV